MKLENYRTSQDEGKRRFWQDLIRLGRCFVAFDSGKGWIFGPSRFVGYINNDWRQHKANQEKDGKVTNKSLYKILGKCTPNEAVENAFMKFCSREGTQPSHKQRKYWQI
jgi:hypothetical protein